MIWVGEKTATGARPYAFDQRMRFHVEIKRAIARAAKQLVQPGQTALIDGGTSSFYFAQELLGTQLQLVTNSLPIANLFLNDENVELILTGGLMYATALLWRSALGLDDRGNGSAPFTPRRCS